VDYDLIVAGGGIAGSSFAARMASNGARVLLLERDLQFHDRIRGESVQPWGVAEMRKLGLANILQPYVSELRWFQQVVNGRVAMRRDTVATTMAAEPVWDFFHPTVQEQLLQHAVKSGVEVHRGVYVQSILGGSRPMVVAGTSDKSEAHSARLVVLSAGRNPGLRTQCGFEVKHDDNPFLIAGILLRDVPPEIDYSAATVANDLRTGAVAGAFPQPDHKVRAYFCYNRDSFDRLQGETDFPRFRELFETASGRADSLRNAKPCGPLASFECADVWVKHPYANGIALLGDAAASSDPSWGQGLSLGFRGARVLSDELLADSDWNAAGHRYAERQDADYGAVSKVTGWAWQMFQQTGPDGDSLRARALPLIAEDPSRVPDTLFSGPDFPLGPDARAKFFAEDLQISAVV